jgi:hypothetical protein
MTVWVGLVVALAAVGSWAQETTRPQEPRSVIVAVYRVAPGKHEDFLRWNLVRERAELESGLETAQWFVHVDGDGWDFLALQPHRSSEDDRRRDEVLRKRGLTAGFAEAIEFRQLIASHTDTIADGPMKVADIIAMLERSRRK